MKKLLYKQFFTKYILIQNVSGKDNKHCFQSCGNIISNSQVYKNTYTDLFLKVNRTLGSYYLPVNR